MYSKRVRLSKTRSLKIICLKTKNKMRQIKRIISHLSPKKNQTFCEKLYFETSSLSLKFCDSFGLL